MGFDKKSVLVGAALATAVLIVAFGIYLVAFSGGPSRDGPAPSTPNGQGAKGSSVNTPPGAPGDFLAALSVELSAQEFQKFKVEPAREHDFKIQREAVGNTDFNREMSVDVFAPFPGKIITLSASAGDDVQKGAMLFTIDSPDLVQAESTLISAAGTLSFTTRALERAKQLYEVQGVAQKDVDQAVTEQQAAEGALRAARDAARIFGKTDAEMDRIVAERKVDSVLAVHSPITGRVTARNAAPGLFVQPGNAPAPYTVSDISTLWMLANVAETDFPVLHLGQEVAVDVKAYPGRLFHGKIVNIGASVDPNTRRPLVILALAVLVAGGLAAFSKLNIEAYPNPAPVILEITAQAPGLSAEEMERYYTIPMEIGLATTPGVDVIRSTSFYGLSFVRVAFNYGVDYYLAYTQAAINLQQRVSLPNNVQATIQGSSLVGEIFRYQLVGPHFGLTNLRTLQ